MSTVVGVKHEGEIWIGGDSRATSDEGYIRPSPYTKVFRNANCLVGVIGSPRGGQMITDTFFNLEGDIDIEALPDAIREQFSDKGCLVVDDQNVQLQKCNFIVGYHGKLYEILADFTLYEVADYTAIGSGCMMALGSLYTTELIGGMNPEKRITLALKAAHRFDSSTGPPFKIHKL